MPLRDLPLDGEGPAYEQIYRALRGAILAGRAPAGLRLPSTRALAADLSVSRTTVLAAYEQLLAEGYVVGRHGSGTYVASQLPAAPRAAARQAGGDPAPHGGGAPRLSRWGRWVEARRPQRDHDFVLGQAPLRFDFRPCVPELEDLPDDAWRRTTARRAAQLEGRALDYGDPAGSPALRRELAGYLARARGVRCSPEQVLVVSGVAQALDLSARLFLDPGDAVLLEEPHYPAARHVFEAAGARLVAAATDAEGLAPPARTPRRCKLAYATPSHQFPTGAVLSLPRRLALLEWARDSDAYVIEDDYDSEFRYGGRAIEALKSLDREERVLYVGTFSKTLFPALRSAYMVLPEPLVPLFRGARWLADATPPVLEQESLAGFLASGDFERHLRRARTLYGRRREALIDALARHLGEAVSFRDSRAGLHLLARLHGLAPARVPELLRAAREREVGVYRADPCYLEPPGRAELLLGFTRLDEARIDAGVARLARVLAALQR
jgi:GntR family transcriptional regulator/MocR family aminotransferase